MSTIHEFPNLRFPEFSKRWNFNELKHLTSYVDYRGRGPEKSDTGIFLVTAKNIKKGYIDYESSKEYIPRKNKSIVLSKGLPKIGDILFTTEAPLGNVALVLDDDIALAQRVIKFRVKSELLNVFLLYYMLCGTYQKLILRKAIGSTVQGISGKELHKTLINFPSLPEQQKIADFLSNVDKKIQALTKKKELLELYKKGVMQKMFPAKGKQEPEIRFKKDDGSEYPKWEKKNLKEVAIRVAERNKSNVITTVLTNSAKFGIIFQNDFFDRDIANQENLKAYSIVKQNDFVYNPRISNLAPVGPFYRNKLLVTGVMSPLYTVFRFKNQNLKYLDYYFETTKWHKYMKSVANYGARHDRMNIVNADLENIPILFPHDSEQAKITNFLSAIDDKIKTAISQIDKMKEWKKGLLQQMFV